MNRWSGIGKVLLVLLIAAVIVGGTGLIFWLAGGQMSGRMGLEGYTSRGPFFGHRVANGWGFFGPGLFLFPLRCLFGLLWIGFLALLIGGLFRLFGGRRWAGTGNWGPRHYGPPSEERIREWEEFQEWKRNRANQQPPEPPTPQE